MIQKNPDSPHYTPKTISPFEKLQFGLVSMASQLPFEHEIQNDDESQKQDDHGTAAEQKTPEGTLPSDFTLTPYTVIIGKGKFPEKTWVTSGWEC